MYGFKYYVNANTADHAVIDTYLNTRKKISEIAEDFGKSQAEIYRILHSNDISPNRNRVNHQKVHSLFNLGWKNNEIAEFTGYTSRNIRYIINKIKNENDHKI